MDILTGEKVFITGAASGIGRSTAVAMAKAGGRLFLTDIKFLYFLKRSFPALFHLIMLLLTSIMDKSLKRER
jgi:hypothetical protein